MSETLHSLSNTTSKLRIGFLLTPQFSLLPFSYLIESLRHAADDVDLSRQIYCSWSILAPDTKPIFTSCGFCVTPTGELTDPTNFDYVILVGGVLPMCLQLSPKYIEFIKEAHAAHVSVVGVCVGSFILAEAGMLDARQCAVHFYHMREFKERYPKAIPISDRAVVEQDNILTCPGGSAALSLATLLIERHCGKARAIKGMRSMLVNKNILSTSQPSHQYAHLMTCGEPRVENAIDLMEQHIQSNLTIHEIAKRLMISRLNLNRAFKKVANVCPSEVYRNIRMSSAMWLLLNTTNTITQIAHETGFSDAAHFSRWFKELHGQSPRNFQKLRRDTKL